MAASEGGHILFPPPHRLVHHSAMPWIALALVLAPVLVVVQGCLLYPLVVGVLAARRADAARVCNKGNSERPTLTALIPCHNAGETLASTLDALIASDYPAQLRHILVVSDASTDQTDAIARTYAADGVRLLRLAERRGKTATENAALTELRGDVVVCLDAGTTVHPAAIRLLVRALQEPDVGVASACDARPTHRVGLAGEDVHVAFEMWLRAVESRSASIVGASGCLFALRRELFRVLPDQVSRDFASALEARERGLHARSVQEALCYVRPAASLSEEYRRKVRTITHGLSTIWEYRRMLDIRRSGVFGVMLFHHKLCRWLALALAPGALLGLGMLSVEHQLARLAFMLAIGLALAGLAGILWPRSRRTPQLLSLFGYGMIVCFAGVSAWIRFLRRRRSAIWQPTTRQSFHPISQ